MQVPQSRINTGFSLPQLFFETDALHQFAAAQKKEQTRNCPCLLPYSLNYFTLIVTVLETLALLWFVLFFMTGALHGAALAVSAAADHGFALLFLFYHTEYNRGNNAYQHGADNDCPKIAYNPSKHIISPLF